MNPVKYILTNPSIIISILLMFGVLAAVVLVERQQEIRNRAQVSQVNTVTVCHNTDPESNVWHEIEIKEELLKSHLDHGDILGKCPEELLNQP